jgi:hypothetical protein
MGVYAAGTNIVKVPRDGTVTFADSGSTNTFVVDYEAGDVAFDRTKADRVTGRDRSVIAWSRKGDDQPITGSFAVHFRQFRDARANKAAICDVLDGTGAAGAAWTKASAAHEEWNLNLLFSITGAPYTGAADGGNHTATFANCIFLWSFAEAVDGDTISVNFECMGGVTFAGL